MFKTLLAGAASAALLGFAAQAQEAQPAPATPAPDLEAPLPDTTGDDPVAAQMADETPPPAPLPDGWTPVDLASVSADTLIGADIRTHDNDTVASVEDVLMSAEGEVDNLVARFGGLLGFGETQVLLAPEEFTVATDADGNVAVMTGLTPEELKGRPEYTAPEGSDSAG